MVENVFHRRLVIGVPREGQEHEEDEEEEAKMKRKSGLRVGICHWNEDDGGLERLLMRGDLGRKMVCVYAFGLGLCFVFLVHWENFMWLLKALYISRKWEFGIIIHHFIFLIFLY